MISAYLFATNGSIHGGTICRNLITLSLPNANMWFPKVIIICFITHWVATKISCKKEIQYVIIIGVIMAYTFIGWKVLELLSFWINSIQCYTVGVAIDVMPKNFIETRKRLRMFAFIACSLLFILISILNYNLWIICSVKAILLALSCYLFAILFEAKSEFLLRIGNNGFEWYLFHTAVYISIPWMIKYGLYAYTVTVFGVTGLVVMLNDGMINKLNTK